MENVHFGANLKHVTEDFIKSTSKYQKNILTDGENYHGTQYIKMFFFLYLLVLVLISNS